jgi:hypothetical protein
MINIEYEFNTNIEYEFNTDSKAMHAWNPGMLQSSNALSNVTAIRFEDNDAGHRLSNLYAKRFKLPSSFVFASRGGGEGSDITVTLLENNTCKATFRGSIKKRLPISITDNITLVGFRIV